MLWDKILVGIVCWGTARTLWDVYGLARQRVKSFIEWRRHRQHIKLHSEAVRKTGRIL